MAFDFIGMRLNFFIPITEPFKRKKCEAKKNTNFNAHISFRRFGIFYSFCFLLFIFFVYCLILFTSKCDKKSPREVIIRNDWQDRSLAGCYALFVIRTPSFCRGKKVDKFVDGDERVFAIIHSSYYRRSAHSKASRKNVFRVCDSGYKIEFLAFSCATINKISFLLLFVYFFSNVPNAAYCH